MSETPDLGPVPERMTVDAELVRRLVADQFPHWADLDVRPVADGGWDNWTFHLGPELSARLPSAAPYALAVEKEHRWLPVLAPRLPLPVPTPVAKGEPGPGYPHPWSVYTWLEGRPASAGEITDPVRFALSLADFLAALQRVDPADGPRPGLHNWYRGGTLHTYDATTRDALVELRGLVEVGLAGEVWDHALAAQWDGAEVWFHGDVARGNLLLDGGELAGVLDFGTCGVGDPACDLAIAWTLMTDEGRQAFRDRLAVDASTWARGRGWALWKALATCSLAVDDDDEQEVGAQQRVLDQVLGDYLGEG